MEHKNPSDCCKLTAEPYTQWEDGVSSPSSACGPATMAALTEYWSSQKGMDFIPGKSHFHTKAAHINYIYRHHGGTPWGMSVRRFTKGIRAYLRAPVSQDERKCKLSVQTFNDLEQYKAEIVAGRPVAIKFDKWFSLHWRRRFVYDYHWVLGIGYEESVDYKGTLLIIHDNGVRHREGAFTLGKERRIPYVANKDIITMVSLNIIETV